MDINLTRRVRQRAQCKIDAALQQLRRLRQKIVIRRVPEHPNPIRSRQRPVVKLQLHVDHMRDPSPRQFSHVECVPDPTPQSDSVRDPGHVHAACALPCSPATSHYYSTPPSKEGAIRLAPFESFVSSTLIFRI